STSPGLDDPISLIVPPLPTEGCQMAKYSKRLVRWHLGPGGRPVRPAWHIARPPQRQSTLAQIHTPTARRSIARRSPSLPERPPHDRRSLRPLQASRARALGGAPAAPPYLHTAHQAQGRTLSGSAERGRSVAQFAQHRWPAST